MLHPLTNMFANLKFVKFTLNIKFEDETLKMKTVQKLR